MNKFKWHEYKGIGTIPLRERIILNFMWNKDKKVYEKVGKITEWQKSEYNPMFDTQDIIYCLSDFTIYAWSYLPEYKKENEK